MLFELRIDAKLGNAFAKVVINSAENIHIVAVNNEGDIAVRG